MIVSRGIEVNTECIEQIEMDTEILFSERRHCE